jgi:signal transduction histidine kinase
MTIANRLRASFAVYVALLVALATMYARAAGRSAESAVALTATAARVRASTDDLARIDQMDADAEKYLATRDVRYRDKYARAFGEFGTFDAHALQPEVLDSLRRVKQSVFAASQDAMTRRLLDSEHAATRAVRVAWIAAGLALILGGFLSVILVRLIVGPLRRIGKGTREVAAGRFDYVLNATGGDELAEVGRDFDSMTKRLAELDRMKKEFLARVSHDLKTPLSSMQETNGALLDNLAGPLSTQQRRLITLNLESGQRLSIMLGKLLDLSRAEAGMTPSFQLVDVREVARRAVELANGAAARRRVRVTLDATDGPSLIRGDASGVTQVLDNLVENAIKFSPPDTEVRVCLTEQNAGEITVTVADQGPGIPMSERERVFDRFYQTMSGRAVPDRGVGLGLTICREIVAAHGGRIWVEENRPSGSSFHVALRRSIAAVVAFALISAAGCATFHRQPEIDPRVAILTSEVRELRAQLDSAAAQADSLRLVLQRIKDIDLKPRQTGGRPPSLR